MLECLHFPFTAGFLYEDVPDAVMAGALIQYFASLYVDVDCVKMQVFLRKMLGTRNGRVRTRFL